MNLSNAISTTPNAAPVAAPLVGNAKPAKRTKAAKPAPVAKPEPVSTKRTKAAAPKPVETKPASKPGKPEPEAKTEAVNPNEISASGFAELLKTTPVMLRRALRGLKFKRSTKRYVFDRSTPEFSKLRAAVSEWLETDGRTKAARDEAKAPAVAAPVAATEKPTSKRTKRAS